MIGLLTNFSRTVDPKVYAKESHNISLDAIDKHALYILEKLQLAGHTAYLVGGGVRDLLLNQRPKDFDISTSAKPEEIKKIFRNCILIGRRFRLAHVRFGKKIIEVSTFRAGDPEDDELILRDNVWGTPEEDVLRRDFTINGLFYDSKTESVIDYVGGFEDLKKRLLQAIGQPHLRFKQDPVRMIRLLKFQARFGFEVDEQTHQALIECRPEIHKSSQARVLEELLRMLELGAAAPFYRLMTQHGMLQLLLPELSDFLEKDEGNEVFEYLQEIDLCVKDTEEGDFDRPVLLAPFIFPILARHFTIHTQEKGKAPHLGVIQDETRRVIDQVFRPFFHIPKRLKSALLFILIAQFRFTPIEEKAKRRIRIPKTPDFDLALDFLKLRTRLEPGLTDTYSEWQEGYKKVEGSMRKYAVPRKKRRAPRGRKKSR